MGSMSRCPTALETYCCIWVTKHMICWHLNSDGEFTADWWYQGCLWWDQEPRWKCGLLDWTVWRSLQDQKQGNLDPLELTGVSGSSPHCPTHLGNSPSLHPMALVEVPAWKSYSIVNQSRSQRLPIAAVTYSDRRAEIPVSQASKIGPEPHLETQRFGAERALLPALNIPAGANINITCPNSEPLLSQAIEALQHIPSPQHLKMGVFPESLLFCDHAPKVAM